MFYLIPIALRIMTYMSLHDDDNPGIEITFYAFVDLSVFYLSLLNAICDFCSSEHMSRSSSYYCFVDRSVKTSWK